MTPSEAGNMVCQESLNVSSLRKVPVLFWAVAGWMLLQIKWPPDPVVPRREERRKLTGFAPLPARPLRDASCPSPPCSGRLGPR